MPEPLEPPENVLQEIGVVGEEPVDTYRWATKSYFLGLAGVLAALGAILGLFLWMAFFLKDRDANLAGYGFSALFLLIMIWTVQSWVKHYRATATQVLLYEPGLVWFSPATGWGAGRWADAVTFYRHETDQGSENASRCSVKFRNGENVSFAAQLENYQGLASHVQKLMHRALYPVLKARYDAGEAIEFGRIVLAPTEFIAKADSMHTEWRCPLDKMREAEVSDGCLWLNHVTNRTKGFMSLLGDIPNYTVLIALLPIVPKNWVPEAFE